jgi:integrating conjugative element protein (TIGR03758 family)
MAMTSAQRAAFEAAAGDSVAGHANLWIGAVFVFLLLWAAWALVTAYRGWAAGNIPKSAFGGAFLRLLLIIVIGSAMLLR